MSGAPILFLALELPHEARQRLTPPLGRLAALDPGVRPARADGLHLTLRFLGRVEPEAEPSLRIAAERVARRTTEFLVELGGLGVFPNLAQPRVVWVGVRAGVAELDRLAGALGAELVRAGWSPERRPFRAHCTLARVAQPLGQRPGLLLAELIDQLRQESSIGFRAQRLALLESVAVDGGPNRYPCPASWPFQAG
ncbi:MAG TPA: RNA 2',3'-cyclic phosphodiesterase [Candidatus Micrarchaeaceae archaeon]|nr:RNA 2',3'-cyclic phosphodiesterase [Candidatus Micrarchaeaceae archaeon]